MARFWEAFWWPPINYLILFSIGMCAFFLFFSTVSDRFCLGGRDQSLTVVLFYSTQFRSYWAMRNWTYCFARTNAFNVITVDYQVRYMYVCFPAWRHTRTPPPPPPPLCHTATTIVSFFRSKLRRMGHWLSPNLDGSHGFGRTACRGSARGMAVVNCTSPTLASNFHWKSGPCGA